jgi:hypothetical protein
MALRLTLTGVDINRGYMAKKCTFSQHQYLFDREASSTQRQSRVGFLGIPWDELEPVLSSSEELQTHIP